MRQIKEGILPFVALFSSTSLRISHDQQVCLCLLTSILTEFPASVNGQSQHFQSAESVSFKIPHQTAAKKSSRTWPYEIICSMLSAFCVPPMCLNCIPSTFLCVSFWAARLQSERLYSYHATVLIVESFLSLSVLLMDRLLHAGKVLPTCQSNVILILSGLDTDTAPLFRLRISPGFM